MREFGVAVESWFDAERGQTSKPIHSQEATEIIRSLIDEKGLVPENGRLAIELRGDLAAILAFANANKNPRRDDATGVQVTLVVGARKQRESIVVPVELQV